VSVRDDGKWKHYRIPRKLAPLQKRLVACVGSCLSEVEPLAEDKKRLKEMYSSKDRGRGDR
jgi:hypothetical protein